MSRIAMTIAAIFVPSVAAAHPEHFSAADFGIVHYLTDPFHVALTCAAVGLTVVVLRSLFRPSPVRVSVRGRGR